MEFQHGLVFLDNATLEIRPLTRRLRSFVKFEEAMKDDSEEEDQIQGVPHIVRRATTTNLDQLGDDFLPLVGSFEDYSRSYEIPDDESSSSEEDYVLHRYKRQERRSSTYTIEVAMFFDEAGYKIFAPYLNNNDKEMRDMLLAYMNGVKDTFVRDTLFIRLFSTSVIFLGASPLSSSEFRRFNRIDSCPFGYHENAAG